MWRKKNLLLFSFCLFGCDKNSLTPDLGWSYFPIEFDTYRVYEVSETTYFNLESSTETYELRESFTDKIVSQNDTTYLKKVERRENEQDYWRSVETIGIRRSEFFLEVIRNNKSIINMSFPVKVGRSWDGNGNNIENEQIFRFEEIDDDFFSDLNQSDVNYIKVVLSQLPPNIVEQDERHEVYAEGIGLVERSLEQIEFCQSGCPTGSTPENGFVLFQRLKEYGQL